MSARRLREFPWHSYHVDQSTITPYGDLYSAANGILDHPALQLCARAKRRAGDSDQNVTGSQASRISRTPGNHLRHP